MRLNASLREAARQLDVHPRTVRRLVLQGALAHVRVGRLLKIEAEALARFIEQHRVVADVATQTTRAAA